MNQASEKWSIRLLRWVVFIPAAVTAYIATKWFFFLCTRISNPQLLPIIQNRVEGFGGYYVQGPIIVLFVEGISVLIGTGAMFIVMPKSKILMWLMTTALAIFLAAASYSYISEYAADFISGGEMVKSFMQLILIAGIWIFFIGGQLLFGFEDDER